MLTKKEILKQNYLVRTHIDMSVDKEEVKKDSKVETARRDRTECRGASTRDQIAIYTFKYVY